MLKRWIVPALALIAVCGMALVPAQETVAAGGLAARLACEPDFGGAFCEAHPFATGFTYGWTTSGFLTVSNGSPSSPLRRIGCWGPGGGTVTVTVTAANGDTGVASKRIGCSGGL